MGAGDINCESKKSTPPGVIALYSTSVYGKWTDCSKNEKPIIEKPIIFDEKLDYPPLY
jgi:hypothetical protein